MVPVLTLISRVQARVTPAVLAVDPKTDPKHVLLITQYIV